MSEVPQPPLAAMPTAPPAVQSAAPAHVAKGSSVGLWFYALLCALPFAAVAAAFSPLSDCGFLCMVGPALMLGALVGATVLLAAGLLLRRARRKQGQTSRLLSWSIASQALVVAGCGGTLLYLVLGF